MLALAALLLPACPVLKSLPSTAAQPLSDRDRRRLALPRPEASSHVHGESAAAAFAKMNVFLSSGVARTRECDDWAHDELDAVARELHGVRATELDDEYRSRGDRRALGFETLQQKEDLWKAEALAAAVKPSHAPGGAVYNATRDGKCAEVVMWWVHHLSDAQRAAIGAIESFVLPLMPAEVAPVAHRSAHYDQQIGCTSCHVAVHIPGTPPVTPIPEKNSSAPQYPVTCPADPKTGKPKVWYNRTKRCDWDYEPFCEPCEGVGGMIWGPNEEDWAPMPCEALAKPADIPAANLTRAVWPRSFSVEEKASLTFPGRDPCAIAFKNSTYTLHFQTTKDGPVYHTVGHSGPSGPSPVPGSSWALPNGNFYNTVDLFGKPVFCICLSNKDPVVDNAVTGPLAFDFNSNAKLVGRERVKPEYLEHSIIADHWVKGPHHFWIDVATNLMVREWQPFNGLQTYYNWDVSTPDPALMAVPSICSSGLLHVNVSCIAPPPSAPVASA